MLLSLYKNMSRSEINSSAWAQECLVYKLYYSVHFKKYYASVKFKYPFRSYIFYSEYRVYMYQCVSTKQANHSYAT